MKWFVHQTRLLRQHGLVNRLKAFLKKTARHIARPVFKFMNSHPKLRRKLATIAKKLGLYGRLQPLYVRISGLGALPLNTASETENIFTVNNASTSPTRPGALTIDEILARIKNELAIQKKY
jgi:hypothetical protein